MADCWNPTPESRPTFSNLLERVTATTQDPEVMNAPLPSFFRPPSSERDITIQRPPGNDDFCLQIPNSDYLIPLPPRTAAERLLSEATGVTIPDTMTTQTPNSYTGSKISSPALPKNLEGNNGCWETSFMVPNSKSDQPLLMNDSTGTNEQLTPSTDPSVRIFFLNIDWLTYNPVFKLFVF
jgi:anaplastic lymphoma kinase